MSSHGHRGLLTAAPRSSAWSSCSISSTVVTAPPPRVPLGEILPTRRCTVPACMVVEQQRLGTEVFQALFDRCSNWGRWGADDERGTLNLITAEVRVRAARLVREGVSVSCAHPINTVGDAENSSPAMHFMVRAGDVADGTTVAFTADYLAVAPHGIAHSHLDALCHFVWQGKTYNGRPASTVTSTGARANAITIGQDGIV